tara:strand:- start:142 stop:588 length:447 start_codon:yes stop_codon:yes gene_type:complete
MDKQRNFGKALKQLRESKEIDLDKISQFTKISIDNLNNLENGNFSFSSMIYVKLFLREYLKYIDPDNVDEIMNKFSDVNNIDSSNSNLTFLPTEDNNKDDLNMDNENDGSNLSVHNEYFTPQKIGVIILAIIVIVFIIQIVSYLSASS